MPRFAEKLGKLVWLCSSVLLSEKYIFVVFFSRITDDSHLISDVPQLVILYRVYRFHMDWFPCSSCFEVGYPCFVTVFENFLWIHFGTVLLRFLVIWKYIRRIHLTEIKSFVLSKYALKNHTFDMPTTLVMSQIVKISTITLPTNCLIRYLNYKTFKHSQLC